MDIKLKRGEIFAIEGQTFLAFGGAASHDKEPGWKTPASSSRHPFDRNREWNKGRTEGKDWWAEEIPSEADFDNACKNLEKVGWSVDHVITHTCPSCVRSHFIKSKKADPTEAILQRLIDNGLKFGSWHFGHFHENTSVGKYHCHFNAVHRL